MESSNHNSIQFAQVTDVGCVRDLNEDSLFCGDNLWLVADGMGGHACGEVASQIAVQVISSHFAKNGDLAEAIQQAHHQIVKAGKDGTGQSGMGTTIVGLNNNDKKATIAWVGDSRAYLWDQKNKTITQLTEDHSLIVRLINAGLISKEEAKKHPQRHMITQCLGSVEIENITVDSISFEWKAEQSILLCSDGLSDDVSELEFIEQLSKPNTLNEKLLSLVELAKSKGGKDNISVIMVDSPIKPAVSIIDKLVSIFKRS